jgi:predicted dehydrogenase
MMKRRDFVKTAAMGSAAMAASFYIPASQTGRKLKLGLIGAGWYGMVDINAAFKSGNVEVVGVCDVDSDHLKASADEIEKLQGSRPAVYKYYNDLLNMKGLEAVFIASPPHWHALHFIAACKKGLDIYCEKPLSYDIREGLAMVAAAEKAGNIVQIGFQRRQSKGFAKAKELIESGRLGDIRQIVAQIHYNPALADTTIQPPPASLDWDEWCGPAPLLEYRPNIGHKSWRLEKEFGNGHLVDWGIHHIDVVRKIMGEEMPVEFQTTGGIYVLKDKITTPDTLTAHMAFRKAPVTWEHRMWGNGDVNNEFNNGIFFYGEKAAMVAQESRLVIFEPGRNGKKEELMLPSPAMQEDHVGIFLNAVRTRDKSSIAATIEDAFKSTATVQLAMIAYYSGSIVKWDQQKGEIMDNPDASKLMARKYRERYVHP